jgi:medium-chain acyl-[acyl-carrier-protein] hydrolase
MLTDAQRWLPYWRETPDANLRMFCFPFGGGGASIFNTWKQGLPPGVEVCPVQMPGRESRFQEAPITRIPQMISLLSDILRPYLDRPFVLFGHSIGALIAFELARQLRRRGLRSPEWLFVSGHPSPDLPRRRPSVSNLARPEFIEAMRKHFEVSPALLDDAGMMEFVFPALRADYELVETYLYQEEPPFSFPISVFGGSHDPETTGDEVAAWRRHTTGLFRARIIDGNHMFINTARQALLGEVAKDLARIPLLQP